MKKTITIISAVCITMLACSKTGGGGTGGGGTPTPAPTGVSKSYIRVTFSGKTLEARDTVYVSGGSTILIPIPFQLKNSFETSNSTYYKYATIASEGFGYTTIGNLGITISSMIIGSKDNNPIDTYPCQITSKLKDLSNSTEYAIDTTSRVTITKTTIDYTEGSLNLSLIGGGASRILATGTFKIYSK